MSKTKNTGEKNTGKNKTAVTEVTPAPQPQVAETAEPKRLGRPVVEGSKRQQMLAKKEEMKASGIEMKRGRKANPNSKRQAHLAHIAELKAAGILTGKKGRPVNPDSKNQKALAEKQNRIQANNGAPLKPGRPKYTPEERAAADAILAAKKAEKATATATI